MIGYNSFFCLFYDFFKTLGSGSGYFNYTFNVVLIISSLEFSNVISIWHEEFSREEMVLIFVLIWGLNMLLFYFRGYYKKVIANENNRNPYLYTMWSLYSIVSIVTLIIRTSYFY